MTAGVRYVGDNRTKYGKKANTDQEANFNLFIRISFALLILSRFEFL